MIIKTFSDGSYLEFPDGSFDQWCVYMVNPAKQFRQPPRDVDYFGFLQEQAKSFGGQKIYADFVSIYDLTGKAVDQSVLVFIDKISTTYGAFALEFSKIYTILYMGMIAEENRTYGPEKRATKLGKRIKRLGVHCLLLENASVEFAANFMRKKPWREVAALCKVKGF